MTEHEKLKEICDEIGYKYEWYRNSFIDEIYDNGTCNILDAREIIFRQEFMEKLKVFLNKKHTDGLFWLGDEILGNLNNIVEYLYNLLELGEKKWNV